MPGHEDAFPAGVLVYVGQPSNGGVKFVVRPADKKPVAGPKPAPGVQSPTTAVQPVPPVKP